MAQSNDYQKREAEFKRDWINQHNSADTMLADEKTQQPVAAIYYYPPMQHEADQKKIWKIIGARMELERLEEYDGTK